MSVYSQITIIFLCLLCCCILPFQANAQTEQRNYLTLEVLNNRVSNLVQNEGKDKIDLSNFMINLSNSDNEFNQQFYQEINNTINKRASPVEIDLSNSIIQGDFKLNRLGIFSAVGEGALSSLFTASEKEQIDRYYPVNQNITQQTPRIYIFRGQLNFTKTIFTGEVEGDNSLFLQPIIATDAKFQNTVKLDRDIFGKEVDLSNSILKQNINLKHSHFFSTAKFKQVEFQGISDFSNSQFEALTEFDRSLFKQVTNFTHTVFVRPINFSNIIFSDRLIFAKSKFLDSLLLINSTFEKTVTFRDIYINAIINLQDAHLIDRLDFSNAFFTPQATINTSGLAFDSAEAKIIGDRGIGKLINIDRLEANETVLRNLIRNFRSLEQIADANYIEYQREQLKAQQLRDRLTRISWQQVFTWGWISLIPQWLTLNLLLILGDYGTNINLIFTIGIINISFFSFLFWLIDRYRPYISQPIQPSRNEIIVMTGSYLTLTSLSIINLFLTTKQPWSILLDVGIILLPIPILITSLIYKQGRYHKLLHTTYFVEDGSLRQFRLLIGRLPIMPRFPFFRDRFQAILWSKRWNWLNYYDFSFNNIFKLGFNDIRLRDEHLPGLISTLVWYQWCLGVFYVILLLWTLSRTIPGLNLLIYF
ncbi:pentapeptide repeat-containing protein [Waterburya agarophytonicola K14]|uniref:Pentapeptide repeat-containing protein n=2 Tax=Waterburya TaxID=2886915 RepID=A0A964BUC2_9CYAN|nr:pentapeptide repeat-containing protein [Waterburya agarophytonicola KI4]